MMATVPTQNMQQKEQARQRLIDYMNYYKVTVDTINSMSELGMKVLKNKKLYPKFVEQAHKFKIPGAEKLSSKPDFQQIGSVIALAKLLEN